MSEEHNTANDETVAGQPADDAEAVADNVRTTPGSLLLAQREALELSLQHVADELNLTMHYVRALESDSYDKLPGDVFVKGYIRSYARLLGLDPGQMLEIYGEFTTHKLARKEEAIKRYARRRMDKNRPWIIFSGIAFVVVAILLWLLSTGDDTDTASAAADRDSVEATGNIDGGNIDAIPVFDAASQADSSADAPVVAPDTATAAEDLAGQTTLTWPGNDRLQLSFVQGSSVDVEHRGGPQSHREAYLAGEQLLIQGTAPFSIVLDNAPGVTLSFNGREADFSSNIKADNSVRLNIGL
ncbi:RodZ domain-containing protein [Pseudohongiella sp.]|uniref:Cytoskeleton protein RodZ-like C-terminal domain-containing protein n=1 Tax=marine sediment metagenome TaxID=412755 RepID=A0A0F9Z1P9_9ZZZZ|nr:RodZ domain-containing protein [Pseudohongiella sp.]HDZ09554.1 helix-turn-helix domain-containing protein [Pseudohongiella sp.]HEA62624.1 helix-turn-helix domain-containing protein [Pseudohongiella sp.]